MTDKKLADAVRLLLEREGATQPFWTTESGPTGSRIVIACQDVKMLHALDEFLKACVRAAKL